MLVEVAAELEELEVMLLPEVHLVVPADLD
jgi:hypothetical protein